MPDTVENNPKSETLDADLIVKKQIRKIFILIGKCNILVEGYSQ